MRCFALGCFMAAAACGSAAPFQNLGFDEPTSGLLPGWQIISGSNRIVSSIQVDGPPFGPPSVVADVFLLSPNNPSHYPVFGNFSLLLDPVFDFDPSRGFAQSTASILQTGDIPIDAKNIHFVNFLS